jgi:hypothetical protein
MTAEEWGTAFKPQDLQTGEDIPRESLPLSIALSERKPAHSTIHITGRDGVRRLIANTAFPLWARTDEFVGGIAIFWEEKG